MAKPRRHTETDIRQLVDGTRTYRPTPQPRPLTAAAKHEIYESAIRRDDDLFDMKMNELADIWERPSPVHQAYIDKWFGTPARWMPGHHVCSVCGEDIDFPGECMSCQTFIEWPQPGYEDWDRTVGF